MSKRIHYIETPGSKQIVVQMELDTHTTKEEIDSYRCSTTEPHPNASFPHESVMLALVLNNFEDGLTLLK